MDDALKRLAHLLGHVPDCRELRSFLPEEPEAGMAISCGSKRTTVWNRLLRSMR
jgi:hypothetical protein